MAVRWMQNTGIMTLQETIKGTRECHIEPDWLLIYEIQGTTFLVLMLYRLGTHSELFKK